MNKELLALRFKAEQHRRAMQEAQARRIKEAAFEISCLLNAKTTEVDRLASLLKPEKTSDQV